MSIQDGLRLQLIRLFEEYYQKPGSKMGTLRFPNSMYYIVNGVVMVCVQLLIPSLLLGCLFTMSLLRRDEGVCMLIREVFY